MSIARCVRLAAVLVCLVNVSCSGSKGHFAADAGPSASGSGASAGVGGAAGAGGGAGTNASGGSGVTAGTSAGSDDDAGAVGQLDAGDVGDATTGAAADGGMMGGAHGTGPGDWVAGDYPSDLHGQTYLDIKDVAGQAGNVRQYKVHVPPGYVPGTPMPAVFCIHGLSQNAVMFCVDGAGMDKKSDSAGFILIMPNGYQNSWNAGTCCGGAATSMLDDVALIRAIFVEVGKHVNIDLSRVYATGLSNGGYLSYRLACQAADIFAAVAPGAGAIGMNDIGGGTSATGDFSECKPSAKVSVLDMHGTSDPLIPYSTQKPSLERIAAANGCKLTTHAATQPKSAGDTTCVTYDGCPTGIDVTGCSVQGGGHVWFGSPNCGTGADGACAIVGANSNTLVDTDAAWDFFKNHPRP